MHPALLLDITIKKKKIRLFNITEYIIWFASYCVFCDHDQMQKHSNFVLNVAKKIRRSELLIVNPFKQALIITSKGQEGRFSWIYKD